MINAIKKIQTLPLSPWLFRVCYTDINKQPIFAPVNLNIYYRLCEGKSKVQLYIVAEKCSGGPCYCLHIFETGFSFHLTTKMTVTQLVFLSTKRQHIINIYTQNINFTFAS